MYSYLLPKSVLHMDITKMSEDGNPGAYNVFIHAGKLLGILSVFLDIIKGFLPVFFALKVLNPDNIYFSLVLIAPVLGHAFPIFLKGRGGKCIAVSFGVLLGFAPDFTSVLCLAAIYLFFSLFIVVKPNFFRSIITFGMYAVYCLLFQSVLSVKVAGIAIPAIVIYKHGQKYHGEHLKICVPIFLSKSQTKNERNRFHGIQ